MLQGFLSLFFLGAQTSTSSSLSVSGDSKTATQTKGSVGSEAPHPPFLHQTADLGNTSVLNDTLPTSCPDNNSFSDNGHCTDLTASPGNIY